MSSLSMIYDRIYSISEGYPNINHLSSSRDLDICILREDYYTMRLVDVDHMVIVS